MLSIFAQETTALESQVALLQSQLAAAQQRIALLAQTELLAGSSLEALKTAIQRTTALAPDAITAFRSAVFGLFNDNNDGNSNDDQPLPAPLPIEPLEQQEITPAKGLIPYTEVSCPYYRTAPVAAVSEQVESEIIKEENDSAAPDSPQSEAEQLPYVELVPVNHLVSYQRREDGEIICCYLAGNNKNRLKDWGSWLCNLHSVGSGFELREAKRMTAYKYEVKIWGMSLKQVLRLAETDTTKAVPSRYHVASLPVAANLLQEDAAPEESDHNEIEPPTIEVSDVPAGVRLEHLNNNFKTEYRVWVWYVGRSGGIVEPHQKTVGTIIGGATGISAYRINGLNSTNQVFTRTLDAVNYLIAHSGYKLDAIQAAYDRHQEEVAAASVQPPLPKAHAVVSADFEVDF